MVIITIMEDPIPSPDGFRVVLDTDKLKEGDTLAPIHDMYHRLVIQSDGWTRGENYEYDCTSLTPDDSMLWPFNKGTELRFSGPIAYFPPEASIPL